jgi:hypothetical protein
VSGYRAVGLGELERVPLEDGEWRPIRRRLGVTAFGVNAYTAAGAGDPVIEKHDETGPGSGKHEELYLVATGAATFTIDGEQVEAPQHTLLLIEPDSVRAAVATEPETTILVFGGKPGAGMPPSPFEYWYSAIPAHEAGDHERAYEIVAEGLEQHPGHGTIHYVLGCQAALMGRREQALEHLRTAFANDPRTREWAKDDEDLAGLRNDPEFPG